MQKNQANKPTRNYKIRLCPHDTKCRNETSKKSASLTFPFHNEKIQEQHATKAQSTIFMYEKIQLKKSALNVCAKAQNSHIHTPKRTWPVVPTDEKSPNLKNQNFLK